MYTFFAVLFIIVCIFLILIILMQTSRSSGMDLFTGTQNILGAQGGDILTRITTILAILFFLGAIGFGIYHSSRPSIVEKEIEKIRKEQPQTPTQPSEEILTPTTNSNK